jgi:hypothetical protein
MPLTVQEETELQQLEKQQAEYEDSQKGTQALDQVEQPMHRPAPQQTRPFSLFRASVGALRDAAQNVFDFTEDVGNALNKRVPLPGIVLGSDAQNGVIGLASGSEINAINAQPGHSVQLPKLAGEDQAGTTEKVVRTIGSFVVPFTGAAKTFGVAKAGSWLGRAGRAMAAGAVVDATMNPEQTNLANTMRDVFGIDSPTLNALASEPDDNRLVARFKAAAVNAPVSILTDALFEAGLRGVRAYRAWRGSFEDADAAVKAAREEMPVPRPEPIEEPIVRPTGANDNAAGGAKAVAPEPFNPFRDTKPEATQPANVEDVLTFLQRKAGAATTPEELDALARDALAGNPADALGRLSGINPLKIDFSALDNPELLGRLHVQLQDLYEGVANKLGRTGTQVTEEMTARAARAMASSADVLKDLYGHTANLDAVMYASQTLVGSHAAKLVGLAERALKTADSPEGEQAWVDFLEAFHRHAYFLGALRGAGSEVGRALRTLQMVQKVGAKTAQRNLKEAAKASAKTEAAAAKTGVSELAAMATDQVSKMVDPAERSLFLGKLIDSGGDLGDLSRLTRTKAGSVLTRLNPATGELRGNLFSAVTGLTNALSGFSILGLNAAAMALASLKGWALSPFGRTYAQAARVQTMVTWAYVDGVLGAWRDAWKNTLSLLEREGMEEVVLNAQAWGAKGLASRAATLAEEGRQGVKGNFERVDVSGRERAFVMSEADMRQLQEQIQSWSTPALMQHSMNFVLKAIRPVVNAMGSASRLGTILFVNGADQFAGTIAARAGAQAEAMRIAAHEAAELQLEGKPLAQYMRSRMVQLTESVDGFADDAYSAGQREAALAAGEVEAKGALFQDPLETGALRSLANGMTHTPFFHLLVPFVKTPLRILERTAIDYSPLGLLKDRVRADIVAGGPRRDEALARIGLGTLMVYTAFQMADDRAIVGLDGDFSSSARLSRPSYSLKVGDDVIEFKRFDPLGTLLGWGADLRAYLRDQDEVPPAERGNAAEQIIEASVWATQANVLSKTWLTSMRDLVELASNVKEGQSAQGWGRYLQSFATRFVPASGIQRSVGRGVQGVDRDAAGFIEGLLKQSFGSATLPVKRDGLLGRPVPVESGDRLFGLKAGPGPSDASDPLLAELERLSFDIGKPSRSFHGVKLTSAQYNRFLELRGQVVQSPSTGLNLESGLREMIKLPEYQVLPRPGRIQAMRDMIEQYRKPAEIQLLQENPDLGRHVAANQAWDKAVLTSTDSGEADRQTQELFKQLGLDGSQDENPQQ